MFKLDFDAMGKIIRVSFAGALTDNSLTEGFAAVNAHAHQGPCFCIFDYSEVTEIPLSSNIVRTVAHSRSLIPVECLRVHIAPNNLIYGLARMFQACADLTRPNMHVVRTRDEALALIGANSCKFAPIPLDGAA